MIHLKIGDGRQFVEELESPERYCPHVLITPTIGEFSDRVDARRLSQLLCGAANVFLAVHPDVVAELDYFTENSFRCSRGMVRVYQKNVNLSNPKDSHRHRFFTEDDIQTRTPVVIEDFIVQGVVRYGANWFGGVVESVDDVAERYRRYTYYQLKTSISEEDNGESKVLWELLEQQDTDVSGLRNRLERVAKERDEAEDQQSRLEFERDTIKQNLDVTRARVDEMQSMISAMSDFSSLPSSIREVVDVLDKRFAGKLRFTDQARKSAEQAKCNDPNIAWKTLWAMGTHLHGLYFGGNGDGVDLEKRFLAQTGLNLALTEGKFTKESKRLMKIRSQQVEGDSIVFKSHVKYGNKLPKLLRVYYYPDTVRKQLIIGHCGDHLDTYSTRKRK